MRRPALVLLIVLVGAGWGAPALGQGAPANTRAVLTDGVGADTTAPWRYYPLGIGDAWEYEARGGMVIREEVVKDTFALGRRYVVRTFQSVDRNGETLGEVREAVRYDTTSAIVRKLVGVGQGYLGPDRSEVLYFVPCPLDAQPGAIQCQGEAPVSFDPEGILVFGGERVGTGPDTVRTAIKSYVTRGIFTNRFAAGIGLVYSGGEGGARGLAYYRVNGEERGVRQFPTSSGPTPLPNGAALTVGPNPTGGAATVRLDLPAPADVRVVVYDALGRRVATLASGTLAAGTHALPLDAAPLAPGVYVVRAEVGGGAVLVRRLTVAR